jgi:hypothetical protein
MLLTVSCLACGGEECDDCSKDSDCKSGMTCAEFNGGSKFCAHDTTKSCLKTTYYDRASSGGAAAQ